MVSSRIFCVWYANEAFNFSLAYWKCFCFSPGNTHLVCKPLPIFFLQYKLMKLIHSAWQPMLADSYSSHHEHYQPHMMPHIEPVGDRNHLFLVPRSDAFLCFHCQGSSAFVYGWMIFADRSSNGVIVKIVQQFQPSAPSRYHYTYYYFMLQVWSLACLIISNQLGSLRKIDRFVTKCFTHGPQVYQTHKWCGCSSV